MEIWKNIIGYEGLYQVSNLGNVRSLDKTIYTIDGRIYFKKGKVLKPQLDKNGYMTYCLTLDKKEKTIKGHRLVALAFIPNPLKLPQVNHKDCIKTNNYPDNLEWCTNQENVTHSWKNGLNVCLKGVSNGGSKLKEKDVLFIRSSSLPQIELSLMYKVSQSLISMVKKRKIWTHI